MVPGQAATGTKTVSITAADLFIKSNLQDFQHMAEVDLAIGADAEATLPALIEEVRRQLTADRKRVLQERGYEAGRGAPAGSRSGHRGCAPTVGMRVRSASVVCRRSCGPRSRTTTGHSSPGRDSSAAGPADCGTSTSTISISAGRGRAPSAMARRRRWAPRSPTGSTAGCRSTFRPTAT